jgi:hypothetical protein
MPVIKTIDALVGDVRIRLWQFDSASALTVASQIVQDAILELQTVNQTTPLRKLKMAGEFEGRGGVGLIVRWHYSAYHRTGNGLWLTQWAAHEIAGDYPLSVQLAILAENHGMVGLRVLWGQT